jgi:hypothetical protein
MPWKGVDQPPPNQLAPAMGVNPGLWFYALACLHKGQLKRRATIFIQT